GGQRALALDPRDLALVPEELDPLGERFGDLRPARLQGVPVDRHVADDAELGAVPGLVVDLRGAQDRLRRDAGVVQAAAARLVALDHGGALSELGGADRGDVTARATPDHDDIEALWHRSESIEPPSSGGSPEIRDPAYCRGVCSGIWIRAIAFTISQKSVPETASSATVTANPVTESASTSRA